MRFFHSTSWRQPPPPGFPPSWLRQMVCIYFTARQPVDFSFLHYASPSLSIFFFPPFSSFRRFSRRRFFLPLHFAIFFVLSSSFSFRPSFRLPPLSVVFSLVLAAARSLFSLSPSGELFVASPFSKSARSVRENGLDHGETRRDRRATRRE